MRYGEQVTGCEMSHSAFTTSTSFISNINHEVVLDATR